MTSYQNKNNQNYKNYKDQKKTVLPETVRLQKILAEAGIASRRKCEQLIIEGKVRVNGKVIDQLGTKVDPQKDNIIYKGKRIFSRPDSQKFYILLYKPKGYLTSMGKEDGWPTIRQIFPHLKDRIFPVGRLDYQTEGLLLLTNDGDLCYHLTHPKNQIPRTYMVKIKGVPADNTLNRLKRGFGMMENVLWLIQLIWSKSQRKMPG